MADREHPKTHVEDQDVKEPRVQPLSPRHEGIDPLTESDTMYPRETTKDESTFHDDAEDSSDKAAEPKKTTKKK